MKPFFNSNYVKIFTLLIAVSYYGVTNAQTILDFEAGGLTTTFDAFGDLNGNALGFAPVTDPTNPANTALELDRPLSATCFAGAGSTSLPVQLDFTASTLQICFDYFESNASGNVKLKFEQSMTSSDWEADFATSMGWANYCVNATAGSSADANVIADGHSFAKVVVFPNFTCPGASSFPDAVVYFDNLILSPVSCDLNVAAGTTTCTANTAGTDLYDATFTFVQTTAPGAGTYTSTTLSGGTIGGDDPNMMTSGTITITGITEGTDADLNIADGAGCNVDVNLVSPSCDPPVPVTFNVDMNCPDPTGAFTLVSITGPFCTWCGSGQGFDLEDPDLDGIWTGTFDFDSGTVLEYKYMVDNFASQENLVGDGACAPITDGVNFANRQITITGPTMNLDEVYGACGSACPTGILGCMDTNSVNYDPTATTDDGSCLYTTTFNVDMNCPDPAGAFTVVSLTGPFCSWCGSGQGFDLADPDLDGIWTGSFDLAAGALEHKYMIDNFASQEDLIGDGACAPITDGVGYANREYTVISSMTNSTNDVYGSCMACPGACPPSITLSTGEAGVADYESSGNITSTSIIATGAMVDYDSATDIDLNADFEVVLGAVFCAFIDGCGGANLDGNTPSNLQEKENNREDDKKVESSKE